MAANSVNRYFEGLLVGGILGLVLGPLTAPKPGAELRRELADSADDMLKELDERAKPLQDKAESYKERIKEKAIDLKDKIDDKLKGTDGADLLNTYMGNNSGPMYTAGAKVNPEASG